MKMNRSIIRKINVSDYLYILTAVTVITVFTILRPNFLSPFSIQNMLLAIGPLLMISAGASFVLFSGSIDLSVGAMVSCICVITGLYVAYLGNAIIPLMLVAGAVMGAGNGLLVAKLKIPSFIATLCTLNIWNFIALVLSGGRSQAIPFESREMVSWATRNVAFVPVIFWLSLVMLLFFFFVQKYTPIGKTIFAVGGNERAAYLAGINTSAAKIWAFTLSGMGSAFAGTMYAYKLRSSVPTVGDPLTLLAISAIALGGTLMSGGKGSVLRTLVGVITVTAISSGMNMMGVDALWQRIVYGTILIVTVFFNSYKGGKDIIVK